MPAEVARERGFSTQNWPRQGFEVKYLREGKTNRWKAAMVRGEGFRGVKAKGAVAYSTARWEGETDADENHAIVFVLIEVDPRLLEARTEIDPALERAIADEVARPRRPDVQVATSRGDYRQHVIRPGAGRPRAGAWRSRAGWGRRRGRPRGRRRTSRGPRGRARRTGGGPRRGRRGARGR